MVGEEWFEIVDEHDRIIGRALRSECHGDPRLVHRVAHVLVVNRVGQILLQKRSMTKDVQPGRWDTSVGGHLDPGEDYCGAALREMREELGICGVPVEFLYYSRIRNDFESENIATFLIYYDGEICFDPCEIDDVRFFSKEEITFRLGTDFFTPNFEEEWFLYNRWCLDKLQA